jgi:nucleotide-binding universal stress UspA family protein
MFKKTLICLDGSKLSEETLPVIMETCSICSSEIILLRVVTERITIPPPESIHAFTLGRKFKPVRTATSDMGEDRTLEPDVEPQLKKIEREKGEIKSYLAGLSRTFQLQGLKARALVLEGEPGETILNYANSNSVSLIVLTSHGSGGLKPRSLGRVAQFVLKESTIPVLVIKPEGK